MKNVPANFDNLFSNTLAFASIKTYAGKVTSRVTRSLVGPDGALWKFTERINKDGSVSQIVERRINL